MIVVANAGPLIALAQIGRLDILPALYGNIHIPPAVRDEVILVGRERPEISTADWIRTVAVQDRTAVELLRERLDPGESAAIVLAIELQANLLLIDEARGRRVAETRGLSKTGTIGTLIAAKQHGLLSSVTPSLESLIAWGFRMDDELYRQARLLAGEA
jgi:uncharacterized protein